MLRSGRFLAFAWVEGDPPRPRRRERPAGGPPTVFGPRHRKRARWLVTVLELPERTARYRLDRLWKLGMCGGRQPYADQGSAPHHLWPSRLADAFHRGKELPRGGEREEPQEQFLRHAAAITGLYVALVRLAPSLGWELLAFEREVEAREGFTLKERRAAIVPDAFVVIREDEAEYHAMVEIDRGTMSIPRLSRKLSLYLGWVASGVWEQRHPYVPALGDQTSADWVGSDSAHSCA
jgi:hypothetical protein